jgi:hypothetical protein
MQSYAPLFNPSVKLENKGMVILPLTHLGQCLREIDMSKGSKARPFSVSQREFDNRWDTIFRKSPQEVQDAAREDEEFNRIDTMQVRVKEDKDKVGQCGCGRSPTGKCIGWHGLTEEAFKEKLQEYKLNEGK